MGMKRRIVIEITEENTQNFLNEVLDSAAKVIRLHPEAAFNVRQEIIPEPKAEINIPGIGIRNTHDKGVAEAAHMRGVSNG
ncbi:MAG: hypothetical protein K2M60_04080 [Lachnospiraceae bacterium]|nr:hypothetical protein [Lachnospiraceae bacterium]MDE6251135.1 hypothetical protein [Lachnospiraceae bacterium]